MELRTEAIHDVIHPTAIFCPPNNQDHTEAKDSTEPPEASWQDSQLNPKNRIDSLAPLRSPLWRLDGCTGLGTQFYAVPLFLGDVPPTRCDVFISEDATESPLIRALLGLDTVFHTRDRARLQRQGICHYILRALQTWTLKCGLDRVSEIYYSQPFGTRIIFSNLPPKVQDVDVQIILTHNLESHHCSVRELADMWQMDVDDQMPPTVDIFSLIFVQQLHDSVCTVRYRKEPGSNGQLDGAREGLWVFKALTSSLKYMYHELRVLLNMPPHPNIIAKPTRLVTKRSKGNDNRKIVVGFLMRFYSGGGLRDQLPLLRKNRSLKLEDQLRWATDICSGLLHIRNKANTYYPDLRLDQIVFPQDEKRPIILDYEQRGVWCEFGAPEVNALEYMRMLALEEEENDDVGDSDLGPDGFWPSCRRFSEILSRLCPDWRNLSRNDAYYDNPRNGYNVPWLCLTPREQEHAEVYMLGRLLWCIFEGMSAPQRAAIWQSYHNEPEFDFPRFQRTPAMLRPLIIRCTRGHRDQLSNYVVRKGSKIVLRNDPKRGDGNPAEIRAVAREFWLKEVRWAEEFVLERERRMQEGRWDENYFERETLRGILSALSRFQMMGAE